MAEHLEGPARTGEKPISNRDILQRRSFSGAKHFVGNHGARAGMLPSDGNTGRPLTNQRTTAKQPKAASLQFPDSCRRREQNALRSRVKRARRKAYIQELEAKYSDLFGANIALRKRQNLLENKLTEALNIVRAIEGPSLQAGTNLSSFSAVLAQSNALPMLCGADLRQHNSMVTDGASIIARQLAQATVPVASDRDIGGQSLASFGYTLPVRPSDVGPYSYYSVPLRQLAYHQAANNLETIDHPSHVNHHQLSLALGSLNQSRVFSEPSDIIS